MSAGDSTRGSDGDRGSLGPIRDASISVRALMDDEVTRENRHRALSLGFGLAMATAIGLFLIDRFEPLAAPVAIQLILSVGLGTALVRFAVLEKRALG